MTTLPALALLLAIAPAVAPAAGTHPEQLAATAQEAVDAFHAALAAGDRAAALGLLSPAVVIFESGGAELSRTEYAEHHLAADMEFSAATTTEVRERRSGGDGALAWVLTRSATSGSFRGRPIAAESTETMILEPGEEGWRILHIHWSSRSAK